MIARRGFTLIELSIALVIIGLIIGGILVGRDLIDAATIRAQVSQIEKYQAAVHTFDIKYGALPGDIPYTTAIAAGLSASVHNVTTITVGDGDGNGLLQGNSGPSGFSFSGGAQNQIGTAPTATGETGVFWVDLSQANLIDANLNSSYESSGGLTVGATSVSTYLPIAKLGSNSYVYVTSINGFNYFGIENVTGFTSGYMGGNASMTVAQAYNIDIKIDDGFPTTGTVAALKSNAVPEWVMAGNLGLGMDTYAPANTIFSGVVAAAGNASSSTTCFDAALGTQPVYSMEQNSGQGLNCALVIRFQ